jgi:GT2 family glycosyltransferase/glycosyltransferase involved in cell wall biosynthesis
MTKFDGAGSEGDVIQGMTGSADPLAAQRAVWIEGGQPAKAESAVPAANGHQAPAVPASSAAAGNLDRASYEEISGWAWDPDRPNEAIDVEILDGDSVVLNLRADRFRSDLAQAGIGDGRHGFRVHNLAGLFPMSRHRVRVRRAFDGRDLPESPVWITRARLDEAAEAFINQVVSSAVEAAARADDLSRPLSLLVRLLGEVTNAYATLAMAEQRRPPRPAAALAAGMDLTGQARAFVHSLHATYPPLYFAPSPHPEVSVIVPVHDRFSFTYECLRSMTDVPAERTFEIILIDDGSSDETLFCALVLGGAVRVLRNPTSVGKVHSCNTAAAAASGRYLQFLGNETVVREGWLDALVDTFEQVPDVGIAGSRLLDEHGALLQAGGIVWRMGDTCDCGRGQDAGDPRFSFLRDVDFVSSAGLMVERALFAELKGFDDVFAPETYVEADLAFRVRAHGRRVVMQPASGIVLRPKPTSGTDSDGAKRLQEVNQGKFYRRWRATLATHRFSGEQPDRADERQMRRQAYFVDDSVPAADLDAGSHAALDHMRHLMRLGYKVTFLPAGDMARIDPYTGNLQKLGIDCRYLPYCTSVEDVFRSATVKPDLVYLNRYGNAATYAAMVRRYFPGCRIVYGVAELQFRRMERQADIDGGAVRVPAAAAQRQAELAAMRGADSILVHSPVDAKRLEEADPRLNVAVVPWTVLPRPTALGFHERSGVACLGGFGQPQNIDAAHYLAEAILPLLRERTPDCTVYLVGSATPDEVMRLQRPGLQPLGHVAALADLLHRLRCTIAPLRYGGGLSSAVLESFAHGLPCVMSKVAAEALQLPDDLAWLVARAPAEYAEKIVRLHDDRAWNTQLSESGLAYIVQRFSEPVVREALRSVLG